MKKAKRGSVRILDTDDMAQPQRPSPADFISFFPWACAEFCCPIVPVVHRRVREESTAKSSDKGKSSRSKKGRPSTADGGGGGAGSPEGGGVAGGADSLSRGEATGGRELVVAAVYDAQERLVEVILEGDAPVPRLALQVLALCLPFAPHLHTVRARRVRLDAHSLHEIGKWLAPAACALTELCLDGCPLAHGNYHLALERGRLRRLSLARCALGDAALEPLARRLRHPAPSAAALRSLDLTANAISDAGAAHLARALRTNRALAHLNLAGNRITDVGCFALLDTLRDFPLEYDEIVAARRRRFERARLAEEGEQKLFEDGAPEPYGYEATECRGGCAYSVGNTTLACLNLAYNELEWPSVARAAATVARQRRAGLVRLVLEGNRVPAGRGVAALEAALEAALAAALEGESPATSAAPKRKVKSAK